MGLEVATYISGLNASNPVGVSDPKSQGDDHLRLIKSTLLNTFPNINAAVSATPAELNRLVGVTGVTGTLKLVLDTSPTIVTPILTTPAISNPAFSGTITGAPTASGIWTFSAGHLNITGASIPKLRFQNTAGALNEKWSTIAETTTGLAMDFVDDALSSATSFLTVTRSGIVATAINLVATSLSHNSNEILNVTTGARLAASNVFSVFPQTFQGVSVDVDLLSTSGNGPRIQLRTGSRYDDIRNTSEGMSFRVGTSGTPSEMLFTAAGGLKVPIAISAETSGALTSASRNTQVHCSGNITLPASGMTDGDVIPIDPRGTARTISRPAAHTMYVNDVDVASATTSAHNICAAKYHGGSKWSLQGAVL